MSKPRVCVACRNTGKLDRGNGTTKPCDCAAGLRERLRRREARRAGQARTGGAS